MNELLRARSNNYDKLRKEIINDSKLANNNRSYALSDDYLSISTSINAST